jgi:crotonobetainyl-CoA:carnitine CoA-transferase CaiB-like acyl-CoA transferase
MIKKPAVLSGAVWMPYRFSNAGSGPVRGVPEIGEHTKDVLAEWAGRAD